jgi:hypothetical protein
MFNVIIQMRIELRQAEEITNVTVKIVPSRCSKETSQVLVFIASFPEMRAMITRLEEDEENFMRAIQIKHVLPQT